MLDLEAWLAERWYGGVAPGLGLRAVAGVYRLARHIRSVPSPQRVPVPVVVAGNFTIGGTGKTPLVIAMALQLAARGRHPGIVSRGHGRRSRAPVRVDLDTPVEDCGDEPKLIHERTGLPVFVDRDRVAAACAAVAAGCDVVLADDGLQHRRLARDIEIEVIDGARGYGNGLLVPAGPLREAPRHCDFRIVNGEPQRKGDWPMRLRMCEAAPLAGAGARRPLDSFFGTRVNAVCGIGNPARFFAGLRDAGLEVDEHPFPDHHGFQALDFAGIRGTVMMTEKDGVKCRSLGLEDAWVVPVEAEIPAGFHAALAARLEQVHVRA
ncbi:tetraacyldisaccharide 4'-kinase [soil metagenome]